MELYSVATNNEKLIAKLGLISAIITIPFIYFGSKTGALGISKALLISYSISVPIIYIQTKKLLGGHYLSKKDIIYPLLLITSSFVFSFTTIFSKIAMCIIGSLPLLYNICSYLKLKHE